MELSASRMIQQRYRMYRSVGGRTSPYHRDLFVPGLDILAHTYVYTVDSGERGGRKNSTAFSSEHVSL